MSIETKKTESIVKLVPENERNEARKTFVYVFNGGGAIQVGIIEGNEEFSTAVNRDGSFYFVDNYEDYETGTIMTEGEVWA